MLSSDPSNYLQNYFNLIIILIIIININIDNNLQVTKMSIDFQYSKLIWCLEMLKISGTFSSVLWTEFSLTKMCDYFKGLSQPLSCLCLCLRLWLIELLTIITKILNHQEE